MTLVRWNPIRDFSALQNQANRLFEDAMGTWPGESNEEEIPIGSHQQTFMKTTIISSSEQNCRVLIRRWSMCVWRTTS
jgi:hypothetical protein